MSKPNQSAERRSPPFVLRAMAIWAFHAFVFVGFMWLAWPRHAFRPWAVLPLLPMLGVVLAGATGVIRGRSLAGCSLALFTVSLGLPAIRLAGDLVFGYAAFALSFFGIRMFPDWGSSGEHFWYPVACASGVVVNLLYPAGYLSLLLGRLGMASRCATLGLLFSWFVTLALVLSSELNGIYVGHGLWVASLMALSLGTMQTLAESKTSAPETVTPPEATAGAKRKLGWAATVGLCVMAPIVVTAWQAARQASEQRHEAAILSENNARIANEVETLVIEHLSNLPDEDPIIERYGRFVAFTGSGHQQHHGFIRSPFVCMDRRAVFEKAEVRCTIDVSARGPLQIETRMLPTPEWLAENPHVQLVKQGSEFQSISENMVVSTSLEVFVRHPEYFTSLQERRHTNQVRGEVDSVLEQLQQRRPVESPSSSEGPEQWIAGTMDSESISALLERALQHNDVDVKVRAIALMRTPQGTSARIAFSNQVIEQLLAIVADDDADVRVRQEAVRTLMPLYEHDRRKLYATLSDLGPAGSFAVQPIVEFLSDRSQRHWTVGGAFDAPVGAVELLGTWGAEAEEAVPILTAIVEGEHPNDWSLAPAAAEALDRLAPQPHQGSPL